MRKWTKYINREYMYLKSDQTKWFSKDADSETRNFIVILTIRIDTNI